MPNLLSLKDWSYCILVSKSLLMVFLGEDNFLYLMSGTLSRGSRFESK